MRTHEERLGDVEDAIVQEREDREQQARELERRQWETEREMRLLRRQVRLMKHGEGEGARGAG